MNKETWKYETEFCKIHLHKLKELCQVGNFAEREVDQKWGGRVRRQNDLIKGCIAKYEITVQFSLDLETFPF